MPRSYRDDSPPRRSGGTRVAEYDEEIEYRRGPRRRERPEFLEDDYGKSSHAGQLVVRDEEIIEERRRGGSSRPHRDEDYERDIVDDESVVSKPRRRDRDRDRDRDREKSKTREFEEEIRYRGPKGGAEEFIERDEDVRSSRGGRSNRHRESDFFEEDEVRSRAPPRSSRGGHYEEDEIDIRFREKAPKDRPSGREEFKEEVIYRGKPRPNEVTREEWTYHAPPAIARETEEWTYTPRPRDPADIRERVYISDTSRDPDPPKPKEREWKEEEITISQKEREREPERRPPPPRNYSEEEIRITHNERNSDPPASRSRSDYHGDEIKISRREREQERAPPPPRREYSEDEIRITHNERSSDPPPTRARSDYHADEIKISRREREERAPPPPRRDYSEEEIRIRHRDYSPEPAPPPPRPRSEYREQEFRFTEREKESRGPARSDYRQEDTTITFKDREGPSRPRSVYGDEVRYRERDRPRSDHKDDWSFYAKEKDGPRGHSDELILRHSSHSRERPRPRSEDFERDEITIRRDKSEGPPRDRDKGGYDQQITIRREEQEDTKSRAGDTRDELVIRRRERSPSPELPPPPPPPEPIRAPAIHQEIITHHRHIDHGFSPAYRPAPPPAPPAPPSPPSRDEIEIKRRGEHNGRRYEENIVLDRRSSSPSSAAPSRPRSVGPSPRPPPGPPARFEITDVPGDNRPQLDEEITWRRYNGVRRGRFDPEAGPPAPPPPPAPPAPREETRVAINTGETQVEVRRGESPLPPMVPRESRAEVKRRYIGVKSKEEQMWTEITKDLVVREALEKSGLEFEETETFFYVMEYLKYDDVARLVRMSDDLRSRRRERTRQIEWERKIPSPQPPPLPAPSSPPPRAISERSWDEERERIVEREYFGGRSPAPRVPRPGPAPRRDGGGRERDTTVVIR